MEYQYFNILEFIKCFTLYTPSFSWDKAENYDHMHSVSFVVTLIAWVIRFR